MMYVLVCGLDAPRDLDVYGPFETRDAAWAFESGPHSIDEDDEPNPEAYCAFLVGHEYHSVVPLGGV